MIGRRYAWVGDANMGLLFPFATLDGVLRGFGALFYTEYLPLLSLSGLVAGHETYFGRRLAALAGAVREAKIRKRQAPSPDGDARFRSSVCGSPS